MSEHAIQNTIRNALAGKGLIFRANVGQAWTGEQFVRQGRNMLIINARPFTTGLPPGFSDLFGLVPVTITADMLGQKVAVFTALEVKTAKGKPTTQQQAFVRLRRGAPGLVPPPVDDIEAFWTPAEKAMVEQALACAVVGDAADVREGIADFARRHRPDELMLTANIFDHGARLHSFALAAQAFGSDAGR